MLEVTTQDYVKTAKSKGLSEGKIVWSHEIRNALIPILTMLGPMVASVLMGTFVIEKIFAIGAGFAFCQLDYRSGLHYDDGADRLLRGLPGYCKLPGRYRLRGS